MRNSLIFLMFVAATSVVVPLGLSAGEPGKQSKSGSESKPATASNPLKNQIKSLKSKLKAVEREKRDCERSIAEFQGLEGKELFRRMRDAEWSGRVVERKDEQGGSTLQVKDDDLVGLTVHIRAFLKKGVDSQLYKVGTHVVLKGTLTDFSWSVGWDNNQTLIVSLANVSPK